MNLGAKTNLRVEAGSGCLFLVFVFLLGCMGLLAATWVGLELWTVTDPRSDIEEIMLTPRGYLGGFAVFLIPSVVLGFAILGIRLLLIHPEPPPWMEEEQPFRTTR